MTITIQCKIKDERGIAFLQQYGQIFAQAMASYGERLVIPVIFNDQDTQKLADCLATGGKYTIAVQKLR